jgi:hypothetical protein
MKPYMVIEGSSSGVESFEKKVTDALEAGYSLAGELAVHAVGSEVKFYQPVLFIEDDEEEWDDEEEEEEED